MKPVFLYLPFVSTLLFSLYAYIYFSSHFVYCSFFLNFLNSFFSLDFELSCLLLRPISPQLSMIFPSSLRLNIMPIFSATDFILGQKQGSDKCYTLSFGKKSIMVVFINRITAQMEVEVIVMKSVNQSSDLAFQRGMNLFLPALYSICPDILTKIF